VRVGGGLWRLKYDFEASSQRVFDALELIRPHTNALSGNHSTLRMAGSWIYGVSPSESNAVVPLQNCDLDGTVRDSLNNRYGRINILN